MIILIYAEKNDKIYYSLTIKKKTLSKLGVKWNTVDLIKNINKKIYNQILMQGTRCFSTEIRDKAKTFAFTTPIQHCLEVIVNSVR